VTRVPLLPDLLIRIRPTPSQTALGPDARGKNVEGAFSLGRGCLTERSGPLLLVDDVITSGSTMSACAATLRRAGVDSIYACASALAL
jgi:predicted amidophosphoribosyltransferase